MNLHDYRTEFPDMREFQTTDGEDNPVVVFYNAWEADPSVGLEADVEVCAVFDKETGELRDEDYGIYEDAFWGRV